MKKTVFTSILLLFLTNIYAQKFSYGALLGFSAYDIEINGPINGGSGYSGLNFGGFAEYKLNENIGVKANLIFTKVNEDNYYVSNKGQITAHLFDDAEIKTMQIHALLKCDVNKEYNKGFYLLGGFRMTNILDAKSDGKNIEDFYKSPNFGAMLGFGVNFAKHFGIELIPECNITNTLDSDNNKAQNFGIYTNLTINIESIIN